VVVDCDGKFDVLRLLQVCGPSDPTMSRNHELPQADMCWFKLCGLVHYGPGCTCVIVGLLCSRYAAAVAS
jgi:hypothetical protein